MPRKRAAKSQQEAISQAVSGGVATYHSANATFHGIDRVRRRSETLRKELADPNSNIRTFARNASSTVTKLRSGDYVGAAKSLWDSALGVQGAVRTLKPTTTAAINTVKSARAMRRRATNTVKQAQKNKRALSGVRNGASGGRGASDASKA